MDPTTIERTIQKLADVTGLAADQILPHYTRYCYISGITDLILAGILLTVAAAYSYILIHMERLDEYNELKFSFMIGIVITGILLILFSVALVCGITSTMAPEAAAISKLITNIRGR